MQDVKPENASFVVSECRAPIKLLDLGMAIVAHDQLVHDACGTPHYVAPEVLRLDGYGV